MRLTTKLLTCAALTALALVSPITAHSRGVTCGPVAKLDKALRGKYNEGIVFTGVAKNKAFTVYVSKKGTFTITTTDVLGISCIIVAGTDGSTHTPVYKKEGNPS